MPRQSGIQVQNNFVKGLITEQTALNFPENAATDCLNVVFEQTGRVYRRHGIDLEPLAGSTFADAIDGDIYTEFIWNPVGSAGERMFFVQQVGPSLLFFDISETSQVSEVPRDDLTIDLESFVPSGSSFVAAEHPCEFAVGNGYLLVTNPAIDPFYVTYVGSTDDITTTAITIQARDFEGVSDGLADDNRPTASMGTVTSTHLYNLINQGWTVEALNQWDAALTTLPSNRDYMALYRASETDSFDATRVTAQTPGTRLATKGHCILTAWSKNRTSAAAADGATVTITTESFHNRPSAISFFAGRAWYSGIGAQGQANKLYYSQIIEAPGQFGKCYQKNDPTAENLSDLLPDDGGVITIPEIARVVKLYTYQSSLLIFATNGIWRISGSNAQGFLATDYIVRKLSSVGTNSPKSITDVKGTPVWWGEDGIYRAKFDSQYDSFDAESLSVTSIDGVVLSIPSFNRSLVKGAYDAINFHVYWLYNDDPDLENSVDTYVYTKVLTLNSITGAFSLWSIDSVIEPTIRGIAYVVDGTRLDFGSIRYTTTADIDNSSKFVMYALEINDNYKDWSRFASLFAFPEGEVDYTSSFITGYKLDGQTQKFFQGNYVFVFLERNDIEGDSGCFVQGVFDYTASPSTGKWSSRQQCYPDTTEDEKSVHYRRLKIRGKGRAMQLRFTSESGKPFQIIGWSCWETVNANV